MAIAAVYAKLESFLSCAPSSEHFPRQLKQMEAELAAYLAIVGDFKQLCTELKDYEKEIQTFNPKLIQIVTELFAGECTNDLSLIAQRIEKIGKLGAARAAGQRLLALNNTLDQSSRANDELEKETASLETTLKGLEGDLERLEKLAAREEENVATAAELEREIRQTGV